MIAGIAARPDLHTAVPALPTCLIEAHKGMPAPIPASKRWPVERTHAWGNAFGKLRWCTQRRRRVVEFYLASAHAISLVGRLVRRAWTCYRWQTPSRRP